LTDSDEDGTVGAVDGATLAAVEGLGVLDVGLVEEGAGFELLVLVGVFESDVALLCSFDFVLV